MKLRPVWFLATLVSTSLFAQSKRFIVAYKPSVVVSGISTSKNPSQSFKGIPQKKIFIINDSEEEDFRSQMLNQSDVQYIEEDTILEKQDAFNNPFFDDQWGLAASAAGIDLVPAWKIEQGEGVVVAVIDTGVRYDHEDLQGALLPGVDLISDPDISGDGDGRDTDASDPGDFAINGVCPNNNPSNSESSWHGTHVAGIIAAQNNDIGVVGVAPKAKVLPIRALGKCGQGMLSDVAAGIIWAAGGSISGIPDNPNPADVINLSLGGAGACTQTIQDAINFARSRKSVVVVASGNADTNLDVSPWYPASCQGVITVGSNNSFGDRSFFSNYGASIDILAPGGGASIGVLSTVDSGLQDPLGSDYQYIKGTSMAAPHISGLVALIRAQNKEIFPDQVEDLIKRNGDNSRCLIKSCGAGLIEAVLPVAQASSVIPDASFRAIEPVTSNTDQQTSGNNGRVITQERDTGGCGSIDIQSGGGGGGGPKNMSFLLMILMGILISQFGQSLGPVKVKK